MITAAILASGSGSRMKSDMPKQFLDLCGMPLFLWCVKAFLGNANVDSAVICVSEDYTDYTREMLGRYIKTDKQVFVTTGGKTRGDSLLNVLTFCTENGLGDGIILTHDSVRPFINDEIINDSIEKCRKCGAAIACAPSTDTVFITDEKNEFIKSVPPRNTVFRAQTPQTFRTGELYEAIKTLPRDVFEKMTDAGSVYSYLGRPVAVSLGSEDNIKITYPGDLPAAREILERLKLCPH